MSVLPADPVKRGRAQLALLALFALQLMPVSYVGLGLILLGIGLMAAEAFVPSFGALGLGTTTGPRSPCNSPVDPNRGFNNCSPVPVQVSGGLRFASVSAAARGPNSRASQARGATRACRSSKSE